MPKFNSDIVALAERARSQPLTLAPDEITKLGEAVFAAYSNIERGAGVFMIIIKGKVVAHIPAESRKDALAGWLAKEGYPNMIAAVDAMGINPNDISVTEQP